MKKSIVAALAFISISTVSGVSAEAADYRSMIAQTCSLQSHDVANRFFDGPMRMSRASVRIKSVRNIGGGWKRIYARGNVEGAQSWGFVTFHSRSGRFVCDADNWQVQPGVEWNHRRHRRKIK